MPCILAPETCSTFFARFPNESRSLGEITVKFRSDCASTHTLNTNNLKNASAGSLKFTTSATTLHGARCIYNNVRDLVTFLWKWVINRHRHFRHDTCHDRAATIFRLQVTDAKEAVKSLIWMRHKTATYTCVGLANCGSIRKQSFCSTLYAYE